MALAREMRARLDKWPRWATDGAAIEVPRQSGAPGEAEAYAAELLARLPPDAPVRGTVLAALA